MSSEPVGSGEATERPETTERRRVTGRGSALVVGAARGIGAAAAGRLAADGYAVVCADICSGDGDRTLDYPLATVEDLSTAVAAITADGGRARAVELDVRDGDDVQRVVDGIDDLTAVVAAAGVVWGGPPLWQMPHEAWRTVIDTNLTGAFHLISAAVPRLLSAPEPRCGRVVVVASAGWNRGLPQMAAYAASKHAVVGLVRSVALELGSSGVTVNAVAPGSTRTPILRASADAYGLADVSEFAVHHGTGRLLQPSEVAEAIRWLCSDAPSSVTGSVLAVDGGMGAR